MPYLGRRGALAPLTSADIPAGIVEGTDVAFLENSSGQTLAGTYSTERMYLSGRTGSAPNDYNYKLEGDVTVTGHLALGSIADEDIVITNDGTERTITTDASGGTLEGGNVLQDTDTHRTSVTGMTGELGSVVTGGSGLSFDTIFPFTSMEGNIGKYRVETGTATTDDLHTNNVVISLTGFASAPKVLATINPAYHDSWVYAINVTSASSVDIQITGARAVGLQSKTIHWTAIGTAS
jgi:hypothetical protein